MHPAPDPYAILRNTATLQAHRERMRLARRAGQPFLLIALIVYGAVIGAFAWSWTVGRQSSGMMSLLAEFGVAAGGLSFAVAALRMNLWLQAHPEPGASGRPGGKAGL